MTDDELDDAIDEDRAYRAQEALDDPVDDEDKILSVPCAKCGLVIALPVKVILEAGGAGLVQHALCPGEKPPVALPEYVMTVSISRDGEELVRTGATLSALTIAAALPGLAAKLTTNWERMAQMSSVAEQDVVSAKRAADVAKLIAEYEETKPHAD